MITELKTRLQEEVQALKLVAGATEFQAASETNPPVTPAAYVIRLRETGGPRATYSRVEQRVPTEIGIVLVVRNVADAKGAAAGVDMETLRSAVRTALLGWEPTGCDPLEFGAGGLLVFRDQHLWWQDSYRSTYDISE